MALDPVYFSLKTALHNVWNDSNLLTESQKRLIQSALPKTSNKSYPESEDMLDDVQIAIFASELLQAYETEDVEWLNGSSREIVAAFKKFTHQVGLYFQFSNQRLPEKFVADLSEYIEDSKSHIAVLNYDNLIYDALCSTKILAGWNGVLVDGYYNSGFSPENLTRRGFNINTKGWFLNLHGSPLFVDDQKMKGASRVFLEPNEKCHIVLTHVKHKPLVINNSSILTEYWSRLDRALKESEAIILFGYSGEDIHLNEVISKYSQRKDIVIVEWSGAGNSLERSTFWLDALNWSFVPTVYNLDNILEFSDWNSVTKILEKGRDSRMRHQNTVMPF